MSNKSTHHLSNSLFYPIVTRSAKNELSCGPKVCSSACVAEQQFESSTMAGALERPSKATIFGSEEKGTSSFDRFKPSSFDGYVHGSDKVGVATPEELGRLSSHGVI